MLDNVWLIPLFPLIGFLINGLFGKKIKNEAIIGGIGTLAIFLFLYCFLWNSDAAGRSAC